MSSPLTRADRIAALHAAARERILVLDGSWGVMIQRRELSEAEFRGARWIAVLISGDGEPYPDEPHERNLIGEAKARRSAEAAITST